MLWITVGSKEWKIINQFQVRVEQKERLHIAKTSLYILKRKLTVNQIHQGKQDEAKYEYYK